MANIFVDSSRADDTGAGSSWAVAKKFMTSALALATNADTIWVKNGYSNSFAALTTWTLPSTPGLRIFVTSDTGSSPASSLSSGATEATSAGNDLFVNGFGYIRGFTFQGGSTSSQANLVVGNSGTSHGLIFEDCVLYVGSTASGSSLMFGPNANNANVFIALRNVSLRLSNSAQPIRHRMGRIYGKGLSFHASSSTPVAFITNTAALAGDILIEASDLSGKQFTNLVAISTAPAKIAFRDCVLPSTFNFDNTISGTISGYGANEVSVSNCSVGNQTYRFMEVTYEGNVRDEHTAVRSGGSTPDGVTSQSMRMVSNSTGPLPEKGLRTPEQFLEALNTGAKTLTVHFAHGGPTSLTTTEIALYALVMDQAGNPLGTIYTTRPTDLAAVADVAGDAGDLWSSPTSEDDYTAVLNLSITVNQPGFIVWWVSLHKPGYTVYVDQHAALTGETAPLREQLLPGHGFVAVASASSVGSSGGSVFGGSVIH